VVLVLWRGVEVVEGVFLEYVVVDVENKAQTGQLYLEVSQVAHCERVRLLAANLSHVARLIVDKAVDTPIQLHELAVFVARVHSDLAPKRLRQIFYFNMHG